MAGPIRIAILANGSQARREIGQIQASLGRFGGVGKKAALLGFGALTAGAAAFVKGSVDVERKFSTSMRMIQASTGAPAAEMRRLNDLAVKLGQDTSFSAGEAADAMLELAKAGLDTKTIMGGGLAGTLQLAAAGGTDLATASTIASNALNTFNLQGRDMKAVAAALAGGANASSASVESLGQALQQVGPGAINAGLSLQETVAALAAFDSAGIKGSDAGTSLKTMLTRLVPTTVKASKEMARLGLDFTKADGSFLRIDQVAEQLRQRLGKLSDEQRTTALATIFGSDATRAATVLMKEGGEGIRAYVKATKDQEAAQKAANARMSGTEGALEKLSGAIETAQLRLGQELAPAIIAGADALDDKLVPALEGGIRAGRKIANALEPAVSEVADALGNLAGEGDAVSGIFNDLFIPALTAASEVVGGLVNFVDELPGPVKEIGLQVGIAALAFPRLTAGVSTATGAMTLQIARLQQLRAEMTYTATRAQLTGAAMTKLSAAAKTAAGVGGMVALTQATQQSDQALGALMGTAGGAALGFSVAGPLGAAVGGLGGLMVGLSDGTNRAEIAARNSITTWQSYASTLSDVTGATTAATKAMIVQELQQNGLLTKAGELGVSKATLVNGILGQKRAHEQLSTAISAEEQAISAASKAYMAKYDTSIARQSDEAKAEFKAITTRRANIDAIKAEVGEVAKSTRAKREELLVMQNFPDAVITKIQTPGAVTSRRDLANLAATYKLTPKQIQTVIRMNGIKASRDEVIDLKDKLVDVGNAKPSPRWQREFAAGLTGAEGRARRGRADIDALLGRTGANAKPNLAPFGSKLRAQMQALMTQASQGGSGIGSALGAGINVGIEGWTNTIRDKAAAVVRGAVAAAKDAGEVRSPSRQTRYIGEMLGAGFEDGLSAREKRVKAAARRLVHGMVQTGREGVNDFLGDMTSYIRQDINLKNDKKERRREKRVLKSLRDEYAALKKNAAAQDAVNARLEKARETLATLRQQYTEYATSIRDTIVRTGDITQLGRQEDGTVSASALVNELRNQVNEAKRFASLITELSAPGGLTKEAIDQLLAQGPEAALATAEAVKAGGAATIAEVNALQAELAATGTTLGNSMASKYYGAGVAAAQGIVAGIEAEAKNLDAAAVKLANSLTAAVKKALGIKSPSRVFAGIGDNVIKGLEIGLDDTYVRRSGAVLAASLEKGFGTPALDAYARWQADGGTSQTVTVRLTAEEVSLLQQGREIQMKLDYARTNGVRGETF